MSREKNNNNIFNDLKAQLESKERENICKHCNTVLKNVNKQAWRCKKMMATNQQRINVESINETLF